MTTDTKITNAVQLSPIEAATRQEFEYYGSTLTTNTALKAICLVLAAVIAFDSYRISKMSALLLSQKPIIVRTSDVGRAEAVSNATSDQPNDAELRYFLNQFVTGYYERNHRTFRDQYPASLYYLSSSLEATVEDQDRRTAWGPKFMNSSDDDIRIDVKNIAIDYARKPMYSAEIAFEKVFTSTGGIELKREMYSTKIYFIVDPLRAVRENGLVKYNPLGFSIQSVSKPSQAFGTN